MKQRYSSLDVKVIAHELNTTLKTLRVSNIYDLSSRIFLFKCARPGHKEQLLVDSGFRAHLTAFSRTANPAPSPFTERLRKYLKTRRITGVSQLGTDRVIEITFSDGQYRLFLEFFAAGNIILVDAELKVLALLRQVSEGNEDVDVKLGSKYVLDAKQNYNGIPQVTKDRVRQTLETQIQKAKAATDTGGKKAKRNKAGDDLRKALSIGFPEYPPHLLEHVFGQAGIDASVKLDDVLSSDEWMEKIMAALKQADEVFQSLEQASDAKGYIIAKEKEKKETDTAPGETGAQVSRESLLYDDFHPFRPSQFENKPGVHILEMDGFNKTVDEFYSSIESQKHESRLTELEEQAKRKLDNAKNEHEKRLGALQQVQELHVRKAQTIEANTHRVEEATTAVNGLIGQGMDWVDIGKLIESEQKRGNAVAQMIKLPLKLHENTVTLLLDEPGMEDDESSDEDEKTDSEVESDDEVEPAKQKSSQPTEKQLSIDIDLGASPWANARQYYDQKKTAKVKEQRTVLASEKALRSMEKKTEADLSKGLKQEKAAMRPARRLFWFEKFLNFISSDGYLVLGGKDAQQNEILYRRYLKKGDIYVHADLHGASSVIVKNNPTTPDAPIPPSTLSQAGALTVCTSSAWDSKAVMAAWWVNSDQVSKTAPTGEYLTTGGFMINGKKNFLPPTQLILGFGVMWQISESSRSNHGKHRLQRTESMVDGEAEALAADAKGLEIGDGAEGNNAEAAIPDLEDAADDARDEVAEDAQAEEVTEDDHDSDDEDDRASTVASEIEAPRSNPLQSNGHDKGEVSDRESNSDSEEEDDGDDDAPDTGEADEGVDHESAQDTSKQNNDTKSAGTARPPAQSQPKPKKSKRGTKAKRLAAQKYALQDEEERELAMSLLGSTKGQHKKEAEETAKQAREEKAKLDKERRRKQHERAAEAERKRTERLAAGGEADVEEDIDAEVLEQERKELLNIDLLVANPEPGDELLAAIPVIAPWTALARSKYKVKLQPGNMKKGKAVKEIVGNWNNLATRGPKVVDENNRDKEKVWARELECFKAWRVEEVVGVIPVKGLRIVQGGAGSGGADKGGKNKNAGGKGGKAGGGRKKR